MYFLETSNKYTYLLGRKFQALTSILDRVFLYSSNH